MKATDNDIIQQIFHSLLHINLLYLQLLLMSKHIFDKEILYSNIADGEAYESLVLFLHVVQCSLTVNWMICQFILQIKTNIMVEYT